MKLFVLIIVLMGLVPACRISEKSMTGTYFPDKNQFSRLILKDDKTFELALLNPATDSLFLPGNSSGNFFTTGLWSLENKKLILTCSSASSPVKGVQDSIARFTNISSFNFWNRFGDPVSIRYIVLPPAKPKPHYGNSLFYFAQDFKQTDTLRFYFDGFPRFDFPGSISPAIGNNIHKITLSEPYRANAYKELGFLVKRNKLIYISNKTILHKKNLNH